MIGFLWFPHNCSLCCRFPSATPLSRNKISLSGNSSLQENAIPRWQRYVTGTQEMSQKTEFLVVWPFPLQRQTNSITADAVYLPIAPSLRFERISTSVAKHLQEPSSFFSSRVKALKDNAMGEWIDWIRVTLCLDFRKQKGSSEADLAHGCWMSRLSAV